MLSVFDGREVRLSDFDRGTAFTYIYDFGDNWRHTILIEDFTDGDIEPKSGTCLGGACARPAEDVGGVPGYHRFQEIMADKTDSEHADTKRWCGGHFDPNWFDLAQVNKDVQNALRANVKRRMYQPKPKRN